MVKSEFVRNISRQAFANVIFRNSSFTDELLYYLLQCTKRPRTKAKMVYNLHPLQFYVQYITLTLVKRLAFTNTTLWCSQLLIIANNYLLI